MKVRFEIRTGFSGDQCRTPIPVWGGILFTQAGLIILICFLAAMVVLRDFIRLNLHGTLSKKPFTAFTTTLVFNFFASLSLSCYYINTLATFTGSFNSSFATFCLISAFFCLSLSGLNISLVWSEIAINVRKMSLRASQNVDRYRGVLVFYYLAFFILALYFAIENETVIFQIVCVPSIVFVIISYFIAYIRIKRVIHEHSSSRDSQGYEKEMRVIARSALRYSMLAFCGLLCFIILIILQLLDFADVPNQTPVEFVTRFASLFLCLANSVISWYLHLLAVKKLHPHISGAIVSIRQSKNLESKLSGMVVSSNVE